VGVAGSPTGISIDQVQLKNINPLQPVQESFNEVNQTQQEKEKLINEARRDCDKVPGSWR
jgi:membrane protease subunit HflK